MAKNGVYGIESFKMQAAAANAFPSTWTGTGIYEMKAIVKDSLSFNDSAPSDNDIEVEDMDNFYATLPGSIATKGFTVQTYDLSAEAYMYLMGYTDNTTGTGASGYYEETPGFQLGNQAVQIITKAFADFPSKTFEWANMACKVTRSGTIGKSGFPNLNIEFKQNVLANSGGTEICGARWKPTPVVSSGSGD